MRDALLALHITCGSAGLLLGPLALLAPKRRGRHTRLGLAYQAATAGLCATAVGLVVLKPSLWPFAIIATATELAAFAGWLVQRRRRPGWVPWHISLICGSYVSFMTAFLVVNTDGFWLAWVAPSVVASPLIAWAARRAAAPPSDRRGATVRLGR